MVVVSVHGSARMVVVLHLHLARKYNRIDKIIIALNRNCHH